MASEKNVSQVFALVRFRYCDYSLGGCRPSYIPDLAVLNDVTDGTSPFVMLGGSGDGDFHSVSSPAPETEYRKSKGHFHALTD
ncbi:unnamed protein product [Dibothriocephalus latus]|uniref:Uncharacterized protein n=1 Tax=Dibothriocephalus latus TaxID=60516 RepID=A0A3P6U997_DIBLA|nr:unnamed protein product [Dibothriocephalus latus]